MAIKHNLQTLIQNATTPWTSLLVTPTEMLATALIKPPAGYILRVVQGKKCATSIDLFNEFARALEFPDYFGRNWDALEECLADLEWLPAKGYALLITDAEAVIPGDEEEYETLLEILNDTGEAWSKGQTSDGRCAPFHVFFATSEQQKSKRKHWGLEELPIASQSLPKLNRRTPPTRDRSPRTKRS